MIDYFKYKLEEYPVVFITFTCAGIASLILGLVLIFGFGFPAVNSIGVSFSFMSIILAATALLG